MNSTCVTFFDPPNRLLKLYCPQLRAMYEQFRVAAYDKRTDFHSFEIGLIADYLSDYRDTLLENAEGFDTDSRELGGWLPKEELPALFDSVAARFQKGFLIQQQKEQSL